MQKSVRFDDLRLLLAISRQGSFLAAARASGLSTSTVARRVEALERAMGRQLVVRSATGTSIEPEAHDLLALAEQLDMKLEALRRDRTPETSRLAGVVRLSVPDALIRPLTELLARVRRQHPEITIELICEMRLSDVARREADFGLRSARSPSKVLIERKLGVFPFGLFAAPSYLERRLPSATLRLADMAQHDFVGYEGAMRQVIQHRFLTQHGAVRFPFRSNSDLAVLEAARQGQGIALLGEISGREAGLCQLRFDAVLPTAPLYMVYHRSLRREPRMQVVARALEAAVKASLNR